MRFAVLAPLFAVVALGPFGTRGAHAAPATAAKEHFDRAFEHLDRAEYTEAIERFWRAYEARPHHSVLYNLGQAYALLDDPVQSVATFERYLEEGGDAIANERREEVRKAIDAQRNRIAEIVVTTSHRDATIRIDGLAVGASPLQQAVPVRAGRHLVSASLPGHELAEQWVVLAGRQRASVGLELRPVVAPAPPRLGRLRIDCSLAEVAVRIDGEVVGSTPIDSSLAVATGTHTVGFSRAGYRFAPAAAAVEERRVATVACRPEVAAPLAAAESAALEVAVPPGAQLRVDGQPSASSRELPIGSHELEVTREGYEPWRTRVTLGPGESKRLRATLTANRTHRENEEAEDEALRTAGLLIGGTGVALGIVTIGHFVWNDGRHDEWASEDDALGTEWADASVRRADLATRQASNDELLASILRADSVTIGLGVGAGALLAAGAALLVAGVLEDDYRLEPTVGTSGLGLRCSGRW